MGVPPVVQPLSAASLAAAAAWPKPVGYAWLSFISCRIPVTLPDAERRTRCPKCKPGEGLALRNLVTQPDVCHNLTHLMVLAPKLLKYLGTNSHEHMYCTARMRT
jgi:hypothetical protein